MTTFRVPGVSLKESASYSMQRYNSVAGIAPVDINSKPALIVVTYKSDIDSLFRQKYLIVTLSSCTEHKPSY